MKKNMKYVKAKGIEDSSLKKESRQKERRL
jgi:hypothetical protein